jgi:hypothetical protein
VGPRAGLEKNLLPLPGIEPRRLARCPRLYRLSYPGKKKGNKIQKQTKLDPTSENSAFKYQAKRKMCFVKER